MSRARRVQGIRSNSHSPRSAHRGGAENGNGANTVVQSAAQEDGSKEEVAELMQKLKALQEAKDASEEALRLELGGKVRAEQVLRAELAEALQRAEAMAEGRQLASQSNIGTQEKLLRAALVASTAQQQVQQAHADAELLTLVQESTAHGPSTKNKRRKKKVRLTNKGTAGAGPEGTANAIPMSHNSNTYKTPKCAAKATAIPASAANTSSNAQRGAESRAITASITPASIDDIAIPQAQLRWLHRMQKFSSRQHSVD